MSNAEKFRSLHAGPDLLILPNAWDAASAAVIAKAGAKAVATSSAAVAWAQGYPDGEALPFDALLATLRAIARVISVPLSADIETAYAADAAMAGEAILRVIDTGAVGINIEDGTGAPDLLCAKIERVKSVAAKAGVDLWVNARTDVYLKKLVAEGAAFDEALARAKRYREAGADSIFIPAAVDEMQLAGFVKAISAPLNVLAWPGLAPAKTLQSIGIRRLSAGAGVAKASLQQTHALAAAFLAGGNSEPFNAPGLSSGDLNAMMRKT